MRLFDYEELSGILYPWEGLLRLPSRISPGLVRRRPPVDDGIQNEIRAADKNLSALNSVWCGACRGVEVETKRSARHGDRFKGRLI